MRSQVRLAYQLLLTRNQKTDKTAIIPRTKFNQPMLAIKVQLHSAQLRNECTSSFDVSLSFRMRLW